MEEILHHLGCIKPCKQWDKLPINWCKISSINNSNPYFQGICDTFISDRTDQWDGDLHPTQGFFRGWHLKVSGVQTSTTKRCRGLNRVPQANLPLCFLGFDLIFFPTPFRFLPTQNKKAGQKMVYCFQQGWIVSF